jgi:2-polyprenyl-6-hydroxyphenyl methylase/3-demethylubiquinone-9 3-methyltransferase
MNIDPLEVKKFDEMAPNWWDKNGECKPLHDLNPVRLGFIQSCCSLSSQKILDIGCGGGILTEAMSFFSPFVFGIDQAEKALAVATSHAQGLKQPPTYEQATAESYATQFPGQFDVITCMEMLEHVPDPRSILDACAKLLKPAGHLFLSTLNRTPKAFLGAIVGAEYLLKLLPKGTHDYERFIKPSELSEWARQVGLTPKRIKGVSYRILSKSFMLSDDVSINYFMHLQKD